MLEGELVHFITKCSRNVVGMSIERFGEFRRFSIISEVFQIIILSLRNVLWFILKQKRLCKSSGYIFRIVSYKHGLWE